MQRIPVVDSHTEGEPTRVVLGGGPDLGTGTLAERAARFRRDHDGFRAAVAEEPRGSGVLVGALLVPPVDPDAVAGVIFFNNVGTLGMCGHGTLGVVATLAHLGRITPGRHRLETPVGTVTTELHADGTISVENVPSRRQDRDVVLEVPGVGTVRGDVAYGGNWFFLVEDAETPLDLDHVSELLVRTESIRGALADAGITGGEGAEIDHVELFGPARTPDAHSRNFVLCPGGAYDRSPCGTGTSAKVACLAADGKLAEGETWIQESVIGSRFAARYRRDGDAVVPTITGRAFVTAEGDLVLDERDPFRHGIPA